MQPVWTGAGLDPFVGQFETIRPTPATERKGAVMSYVMKPLACDPARIKGMSEKLIVSHYENNSAAPSIASTRSRCSWLSSISQEFPVS